MSLEPGTQIGRFRISRLIAQGGMAEVYRAEQELAGGILRPTALKVIRPEYSESPDFREMFLDEARLACTLSHPNIVHIYEVGESDGRLFMAMELVPGESLAFVSRQLREKNDRFSDEALIAIGIFTCSALEMVHALRVPGEGHVNLVHRDVSPHNLLLGPTGSLKLIDFGIAKATTNRNLTSAGVTKGKAGYFSPEQAMGRALDGRSDLFSLGVTLYKLAWGATPFDQHKTHHERNTALVHGRWRPLREVCPGLPEGFYAIVDRSLQVHAENRFADATEMRMALESLAMASGLHVGPSALAGYVEHQADDPMALGARPLPASARHSRLLSQQAQAAAAALSSAQGGGANAGTQVATGMPGNVAGVTAQAPASGLSATAVATGRTRAAPISAMNALPTQVAAGGPVAAPPPQGLRAPPTAALPPDVSGALPDSVLSSPGKPRHTERLAPRTPGSAGPPSRESIEVQRTRKRLFLISGSAIVFLATVIGLIIGSRVALSEEKAAAAHASEPIARNDPEHATTAQTPSESSAKFEATQVVPKHAVMSPPVVEEKPAAHADPGPTPTKVSARSTSERTSQKHEVEPARGTKNREVLAAKTPVAVPDPGTKSSPPVVVDAAESNGPRADGKLRIGGAEDAQVEVNGKRWGMSPLDRKVAPGSYVVVVRSIDGKKELSRTVEVKSDRPTMVRFDLAKGAISSSN